MRGQLVELVRVAEEAISSPAGAPLLVPRRPGERRSPERLRAHYDVERRLADRLRASASFEERRSICASMYDELFRLVPDHPRIAARRAGSQQREHDIAWNLAQLAPYLRPGCTFLEIGAGDCALSARVAAEAERVYAVDISDQTRGRKLPANIKVVISDGRSIPVPEGSIDVAFSDQLMEHLHPDDALEQLRAIHRALKAGGVYVCITPNRLHGPNDISTYFEHEARGFHLREYTLGELRTAFAAAGFAKLHVYAGARGRFVRCPAFVIHMLEGMLDRLAHATRRKIADRKIMRALLGLRVAAIKETA